jgi:hypothetical protein
VSDKNQEKSGSCFCGAVKYKATGEPFWVGHCHCRSCRKITGAPVVTFAGYKKDQVEFTGHQRKIHISPPNVTRAFCDQCGTPLTWEGESNSAERGSIIELYISTFDDPDSFSPTNHVWYPEHISWFEIDDDLPRFRGFDFNSDIVD